MHLEPGIHHGIPFRDYQALPYLNASSLKWGRVSMRHLKASVDGDIVGADSEAKKFGRAAHVRILEPHRWGEIEIAKPCCAILKSGPRKGAACGSPGNHVIDAAWFCGSHAPDAAYSPPDYVSQDEAKRIEAMAQSVNWPP